MRECGRVCSCALGESLLTLSFLRASQRAQSGKGLLSHRRLVRRATSVTLDPLSIWRLNPHARTCFNLSVSVPLQNTHTRCEEPIEKGYRYSQEQESHAAREMSSPRAMAEEAAGIDDRGL